MLNIKSINPSGMFAFGLSETFNVANLGQVFLLGVNEDKPGESNGAGKSSFFNSLCEILYGKNPTDVSGDGVINTYANMGFAGRVTFSSWENIEYRVTYCRKCKKPVYPEDNNNRTEYKGTQLYLDKLVNGNWVDARGAALRETRNLIEQAVGLSYSQFLAVAYMTPRQGNQILKGSNIERQAILSGLVGLDAWDSILVNVRNGKKTVVKQHSDLEKEQAYLDGELQQIKAQIQQLDTASIATEIQTCKDQITQSEAQRSPLAEKLRIATEELAEINKAQEAARANIDITASQKAVTDAQNALNSIRMQQATLQPATNPELQVKVRNAENALNQAKGLLQAVRGSSQLGNVDKCPTCGSKITKAAKTRLEQSVLKAQKDVEVCENDLSCLQAEFTTFTANAQAEVETQRAALNSDIDSANKGITQAQAEYKVKLEEYNSFGAKIQEKQAVINKLNSDINEVDRVKAQWAAREKHLSESLVHARTWEDQLALKNIKHAENTAQLSDLFGLIKHYDWLITNIPFIKLHKLSVALTDLSCLANGHLAKMGDTANIRLSSFKEKQKAKSELTIENLKSEIEIVITDGEKNIDPRLYSEGETSRFSLALVRAMHDLALKHGHGCNLVLLDEIFSFMDPSNSQKVAASFSDEMQPGSTYIITDNSGVAVNYIDFDSTWSVTKKNGITTLKGL